VTKGTCQQYIYIPICVTGDSRKNTKLKQIIRSVQFGTCAYSKDTITMQIMSKNTKSGQI
jgi:hypothetical protein